MSSITLQQVVKDFGEQRIIKGVDLEIGDGEFVVFVGPSGCGKSTLLRLIAGLEEVSSGKILIDGVDVSAQVPYERELSMVFQSYALYPHMNVGANMGFALKTAKIDKTEIDARVQQAASILKLEQLLDRLPRALSGGQRQRVAIGRAIVRKPKGFLFDEPLSNLDAALRVAMRVEIAQLHQQLASTMIYVTHDQVEAMTLADKIVVLSQGEIMQVGSPRELYERPASLFVAEFIGSPRMNILPLALDNLPAPTGADKLGIRPEHINICDADEAHCQAEIKAIEYLGADSYIYLHNLELGELVVRSHDRPELQPGQQLQLNFPTAQQHFFNAEGERVS